MKLRILWNLKILLLVSLLGACACPVHATPREDADKVIATFKRDAYTLDLSRMRRGEEGEWKERSDAGKLEKFGFPKFVPADGYYYTVYIDAERHAFWVRRTGGFAPQNLLYGPEKIW